MTARHHDPSRRSSLQRFWDDARAANPDSSLPDTFSVRCIGGDAQTTSRILDHIRSGDKTGTVSLPSVQAETDEPVARVGDAIILTEFDGSPAVLVQVMQTETVAYSQITEAHTSLDGPNVRALDVWIPIHRGYFEMLLAQCGLSLNDETPVTFEMFKLMHNPGRRKRS